MKYPQDGEINGYDEDLIVLCRQMGGKTEGSQMVHLCRDITCPQPFSTERGPLKKGGIISVGCCFLVLTALRPHQADVSGIGGGEISVRSDCRFWSLSK